MKIKILFRKLGKIVLLLMIIIILTIIMKVFMFASFYIPTPSMAPSILPGDHIVVNKLILGPRIYENPGFLKGRKTKMKRINGMRKVRRNDVLVFDFPYSTPNKIKQGGNIFYVKRCVAIPGDTFYIDNGIYKVIGVMEGLGHVERQKALSEKDETSFKEKTRNVFPKDTTHFRWTIKHFGPLYIPGKDDNIRIDSMNILLYKNIIEYETKKYISIEKGEVYLDNITLDNYTFQQDYYFMAGDLVRDSQDSRYWGLLPDDLVIGKATIVWKSQNSKTGKYNWDRFFKIIK